MPKPSPRRIRKSSVSRNSSETFEERAHRVARFFEQLDTLHKNWEHVRQHGRNPQSYFPGGERFNYHNQSRVLSDFIETHALLEMVSKGKLSKKKILQLGASTGVYARFLQQHYGAMAVPIDVDFDALHIGRTRGAQYPVHASAVNSAVKGNPEWVKSKSGILIPNTIITGLPFRTNSFDYIVCDHFLFSGYSKDYIPPGFEEHKESISRSEDTLTELNRIMKRGGRVVITRTHAHEIPELSRYQLLFRIHGFEVEHAYHHLLGSNLHERGPSFMVLRKVSSVQTVRRK